MGSKAGKPQQQDVTVLTDIPLDQLTDPESVAIDRAIKQLGDASASVNIYRQGPSGYRDLTFLFCCLPSEWVADGLPKLQREYGKGIYRIHVQDDGGAMKVNKAIAVEALPNSQKPAAVAASAPSGELALILASIAETNKNIAAMVDTVRNAKPMDTLKDVVGMVKMLMPASNPTATPLQSVQDGLAMAQSLLGVAKSLQLPSAPAAVDHDGKIDVGGRAIDRGIDLITRMFEQSAAANVAPAPRQPKAVQRREPQQPQQIQPQQTGDDMTAEDRETLEMIALQLKIANRAAAKGTDAADFAESAYALIPEDVIQAMATDAQWFAYLTNVVPECAPHREWYERVRARVLELATEDGVLTVGQQPPTMLRPDTHEAGGDGVTLPGNDTGDTGGAVPKS